MSAFDDAVTELYQAPLGSFIADRKRLAGELKAAGDKTGASKLAKLPRPPISAWVVNQLWWHARDAFDKLLETADTLRRGDLKAAGAHRDAIAKLRARAATILGDAGHGATEGTLRRVTTTLAALAATGGFDPDPPGALTADRDPPGFEAVGIASAPAEDAEDDAEPEPAKPAPARPATHDAAHARHAAAAEKKQREAAEVAARAEAAAERRRIEEQRAKLAHERHRLEAALRTARGDVAAKEREITKLEKQVATARDHLAQAQAIVEDLQAKLDGLAS